GMAQRRANRLDEGLVARPRQGVGREGRHAPILAKPVELVGRCADADAGCDDVLPDPSVGASRIKSDRQILDERHGLRGARQLLVEQPLEPRVEAHAVSLGGGEMSHAGSVGVTTTRVPSPPVAAKSLDEGTERGVASERRSLLLKVAVKSSRAWEPTPQ